MRLSEVIERMKEREKVRTYGSETTQWGSFVQECKEQYNAMPWQVGDSKPDTEVDEYFATFWCAIADENFEKAEEYGEVPEDWYFDLD